MKYRKEGSLRLSTAIIMFAVAVFIENVGARSFILIVGGYALISGIVWLKRAAK
ncbi:hypothetical protein M4D81_05635 [Paenibacillus sp. p3-SID867]|uniref:hypothetical protein n=1 Tax=Paenibacillus sp. p3-SID867 TaxID=2916363 RepID=UPI0021A7A70F|nr:hypothetical protein [Paenibacillus sp. p3-SID867]MCT1398485.1 hypothetical protein [Paenibacillus sp. p3-SID867]